MIHLHHGRFAVLQPEPPCEIIENHEPGGWEWLESTSAQPKRGKVLPLQPRDSNTIQWICSGVTSGIPTDTAIARDSPADPGTMRYTKSPERHA